MGRTAVVDSVVSPASPSHPPVAVCWGEPTNDKMCIGFLRSTRDQEQLASKPPPRSLDPLADWRPGTVALG